MTKISKYFSIQELTESPTARAHNIEENFNPPANVVANATRLADKVLDEVRDLIGTPLHISSWYRSPELNTLVGGMKDSQHLTGEAADIYVTGFTAPELYQIIKVSKIEFDELIIEHDSHGNYWVHISYSSTHEQRCICMKGVLQAGGGTVCIADGCGAFKNAMQ